MRSRRQSVALALASAVIVALAGCNDNELGRERREPNHAPQTTLSSGPPDSSYGANYRVHLYWAGSDIDGTIDHYDFVLVDHPPANDSIAASDPDYAQTVVVTVPDPADPRWTSTTASDTIIPTRADTLRIDPAPPAGSGEQDILEHDKFVRRQSFERWHTFFVRAVDNEGSFDPTPVYRSFNARTLAPEVWLEDPVNPKLSWFTGPRTIIFHWAGVDDTGEGFTIDPIASRWAIVPAKQIYTDYPHALYRLPAGAWQPWRAWNARDGSGRRAIVRNLQPFEGESDVGYYYFVVQAMDEAGAVTPLFDAHTGGKNNVAKVFVNDAVGARLIVNERSLGTYNFVGGSHPVQLDVAANQPLSFWWRADATSYGGEIEGFRYGWNIRNPSNDDEWTSWCKTCLEAPTRAFSGGTQRFFLECRDNAETVTHAEFELAVQQVTRRRDLLLVDDSYQPHEEEETEEDRRWQRALDSLLLRADQRGQRFDFDFSRDIYDVVVDYHNFPPPLTLVFDYKTVIWSVVQGGGSSAINRLADFFDPFVQSNENRVVPFNYLGIYVDNGGEFWLMGDTPATAIFSAMNDETDGEKLPVNITDWKDRKEPHPPGVDSVGVASFLYKLGVEAVDLGSGSRAINSRQGKEHGCVGLRRATPQGYELQRFASAQSLDHAHDLVLRTADVDQPPASGVTYATELAQDHRHEATLSPEELRALSLGRAIRVTSTVSPTPATHTHSFEIHDRVGLWGAPAALLGDDRWWPLPEAVFNEYRSRANVEIYNMPILMEREHLLPEPGISVVSYLYASATPEDPNQPMPGYERTADNQPVVILRKTSVIEPYYSRAICGFEPWRLRQSSMLDLVDYVLLRAFRLGVPEAN